MAGNSVWLLLARISSQGFGFVFAVLIARFLGEAGLGQYSFISASIFLGNAVSSFGMDTLLVREVASQKKIDKKIIGNAIWLQLSLSILYIIALQLIADRLPLRSVEAISAIRVYSLALFPLAFFSVFSAVLRGAERMKLYFVTNLVGAGIQVSLGALLLLTGGGILEIAMLQLFTNSVTALIAGWLSYRYVNGFAIKWQIAWDSVVVFAHQSLPFAALAVFGFLLHRMGVFTLSFIAGESETGIYSAAYRLIEGSKIMHFALLGALLPRLSNLHQTNDGSGELKSLDRKTLQVLLFLGVGMAAALTVAAPFLIEWIYGASYASSIFVLQVGIWVLVPYAWTAKKSVELVAQGNEASVLKGHLIAFVGAVCLYPILIGQFNEIGAAIGLIVSEVILAVYLGRVAANISQAPNIRITQ